MTGFARGSDSASRLVRQARQLAARGQLDEGRQLLSEAVRDATSSGVRGVAYHQLGELAQVAGSLGSSAAAYQSALHELRAAGCAPSHPLLLDAADQAFSVLCATGRADDARELAVRHLWASDLSRRAFDAAALLEADLAVGRATEGFERLDADLVTRLAGRSPAGAPPGALVLAAVRALLRSGMVDEASSMAAQHETPLASAGRAAAAAWALACGGAPVPPGLLADDSDWLGAAARCLIGGSADDLVRAVALCSDHDALGDLADLAWRTPGAFVAVAGVTAAAVGSADDRTLVAAAVCLAASAGDRVSDAADMLGPVADLVARRQSSASAGHLAVTAAYAGALLAAGRPDDAERVSVAALASASRAGLHGLRGRLNLDTALRCRAEHLLDAGRAPEALELIAPLLWRPEGLTAFAPTGLRALGMKHGADVEAAQRASCCRLLRASGDPAAAWRLAGGR